MDPSALLYLRCLPSQAPRQTNARAARLPFVPQRPQDPEQLGRRPAGLHRRGGQDARGVRQARVVGGDVRRGSQSTRTGRGEVVSGVAPRPLHRGLPAGRVLVHAQRALASPRSVSYTHLRAHET